MFCPDKVVAPSWQIFPPLDAHKSPSLAPPVLFCSEGSESRRHQGSAGVLLGLILGLTSCTLPTPVAPVAPERVVLELEPAPLRPSPSPRWNPNQNLRTP
jgi:hypothetical protein